MTAIPKVDRRTLRYKLSASVDERVVVLTAIRVTVLPVGTRPDRSTSWRTVPVVEDVAEVTVAGPDVPEGTVAHFLLDVGDYLVWHQLSNGDDTITDDVERLSVE